MFGPRRAHPQEYLAPLLSHLEEGIKTKGNTRPGVFGLVWCGFSPPESFANLPFDQPCWGGLHVLGQGSLRRQGPPKTPEVLPCTAENRTPSCSRLIGKCTRAHVATTIHRHPGPLCTYTVLQVVTHPTYHIRKTVLFSIFYWTRRPRHFHLCAPRAHD